GMPLLPVYMAKAGGFFFLVFGFISLVAGLVTINPIWNLGPYRPDLVSTGAQPDWYMGFAEGLVRAMPGWEINFWGHTLVLGVFIPLLLFGLFLAILALYPFIESWITGDKREHHILDRPRNAPTRTAFGAAWVTAYMGFAEGLVRAMPGWEINFWGHTLVLGVFIPLLLFGLFLAILALYPFIESWITGDKREHHILDRPRNAPTRTAFGVAWVTAYM